MTLAKRESWIGRHKSELDTPCLVIDIDRLDTNLRTMQRQMDGAGKQLRPHAKTHKCSLLAKRQISRGAVGMCVAKVSEAMVLVECSLKGTLLTGPLATPEKLRNFLKCLALDPECSVVIDSLDGARLLHQMLREHQMQAKVLIDIDIGQGRTGVAPEVAFELFCRVSEFSTLHINGIQAYAGHVQHIKSGPERRERSLQALGGAVKVFQELRQASFACDIFSVGGTGTYDIDVEVPEVTELQAGSYSFMDAEYLGLDSVRGNGPFAAFEPALTILTSVVSANHQNCVTVDAGLKSIYQHGATPLVVPNSGEWRYGWFGDEYGKVSFLKENAQNDPFRPRLGQVLELVVSHCDPTVNLFDQFYIVQDDLVVDIWPVDLRGKSA